MCRDKYRARFRFAGVHDFNIFDRCGEAALQLAMRMQVTTPTIGIGFAAAGIAASLKVTDGALAQTVDPKGPAGKAGLLGIRRGLAGVVAGDVIVGVDGKRIRTASDVEAALNNKAVGDTLRVTYKRGTDGVRSIAPAAVPCAAAKSL